MYLLLFQAVAGNIMTASPISDLNPLFLAAGVTLTVASKGQSLLEILVSLYHYSYRRIHVQHCILLQGVNAFIHYNYLLIISLFC